MRGVSISRAAVATAAFGAAFFVTAAVAAETRCLPRDEVLAHLHTNFGEAPAGFGVAGSDALVELLVSPGGETWTLLITRRDGTSCLLASGEGWRAVAPRDGEGT